MKQEFERRERSLVQMLEQVGLRFETGHHPCSSNVALPVLGGLG